MISFKKFIHSIKNAVRGLLLVAEENNFKIILFVAGLTMIFAVVLPLERWEWLIVIFLIGFVISVEMINSKLERVMDNLKPTYDKSIKDIKDISAGAVLIACFTSLVIGILIFTPYLLDLIN